MDKRNIADHSSEVERELLRSDSELELSSCDEIDDTDEDPDFELDDDEYYDSEDFIAPTPSPPRNITLPVSRPSISSDTDTDDNSNRPRVISPRARQVLSDSDDDNIESDWEDVNENNPPDITHNFDFQEIPGLKHVPPTAVKPIDFFNLFFTTRLLEMFVKETNRYAESYLRSKGDTLSPRSRFRKWLPVTVTEIRVFIATIFNMGLVDKPTIKSYWSKSCVATPWFSKVFSRDRFENILSFFSYD